MNSLQFSILKNFGHKLTLIKFYSFPRIRRKHLLIFFGMFTFCYFISKFTFIDFKSPSVDNNYEDFYKNITSTTNIKDYDEVTEIVRKNIYMSTIMENNASDINEHFMGKDDGRVVGNILSDLAGNNMSDICPENPPGLVGKLNVPSHNEIDATNVKHLLAELESTYKNVLSPGGSWKPKSCQSIQKLALIIPFRDRLTHLSLLLKQLHSILQKQLADYTIYVVEQEGNDEFNKARMFNIAFDYINRTRNGTIDCFIFHDVDLAPETDNNLYRCNSVPRHLSPAVSTLKYQLPYRELIGGVLAMTPAVYEQVNGYSNLYWGWGGEDDDLFYRMEEENLTVSRPSLTVGRFTMLKHNRRPAKDGKIRFKLVWSAKTRYKFDGVAQIANFNCTITFVKKNLLFTHMMINVGPPPL